MTFKRKLCKHCKGKLEGVRPFQEIHDECAVPFAVAVREKRLRAEKKVIHHQQREQRKLDKHRKEKLKTRQDWIRECQSAVNRYCRLRDLYAGRVCITCGAKPARKFGGAMDAGHFRSTGAAPQLRFWTTQIRLQCVKCNRNGAGRALEFRQALVKERGSEWVEWIESMNHSAKFDIEYLKRLKLLAQKKIRRLEKCHGALTY